VSGSEVAYLAFGLTLCALLVIAVLYYYAGKRRAKVEEPKYKMLRDDDE
jgi:hypothetical protein